MFSLWTSKEFYIENLGQVPFDFKIKMDNIVRKGLIKISRSEGKIAGNNRTKIVVNFCPALPGDYIESFKIQVAHFEAETITVRGYGLYPALKLELPRKVTDNIRNKVDEDGLSFHNASGDTTNSGNGKRYPSNEVVSELDRKLLYSSIMKNIEKRDALNHSAESSFENVPL